MNVGFLGSGSPQQLLPFSSNWHLGGADNFGLQSASTWPLAGNQTPGVPYASPGNQPLSVPKGWRNGDWICNCGFHNYSSRSQCKNCDASIPPASEEFVHDWDHKRLNSGQGPGFDQIVGATSDPKPGAYPSYPSLNPVVASNWSGPVPFPPQAPTTTLLGKGLECSMLKKWSRDWCKTQRETDSAGKCGIVAI
ncbi:protein AF-9-like protein [Hibiscus syriacus]|uniref:Protein AF-9-like protein n=1 Tax=Hibiscus syriacus TaxID=106335 RepID=A0A6A2XVM6_HIBSY|nr:protein AF-9-like protein [Hibiscus syriacus]